MLEPTNLKTALYSFLAMTIVGVARVTHGAASGIGDLGRRPSASPKGPKLGRERTFTGLLFPRSYLHLMNVCLKELT